MKSHLWHILGCAVPIGVIFLLPLVGVSDGTGLLIFIVLMFACHLFMMRGHNHAHTHSRSESQSHGSS